MSLKNSLSVKEYTVNSTEWKGTLTEDTFIELHFNKVIYFSFEFFMNSFFSVRNFLLTGLINLSRKSLALMLP